MSDGDGPIVGIDLGTTNSAAAIFRRGGVEVIPNALGDELTPSVIGLDERGGSLLVGRTAKDIYAVNPQLGAATFKRGMGTDLNFTIAGARYSSVELSSMVLKQLKTDAERHLSRAVERCVITVPAYFNEAQRYATRKAGEIAGWIVERILNEPTAAAIAHGSHQRTTDGTLLVFDLGGGTFDVCVMDRFEGALMVRSVAGESMLGGEDFTRRMASVLLSSVDVPFERAEMVDAEAMALLIKRAELAKRKLTTDDAVEVTIPPFHGLLDTPTATTVTRESAEDAFGSLIDRLRGPCRAALRGAQLNRTDIDEIILVGGATRMPGVRRFVTELFEQEPLGGVDPDLAVVHGAAIQAALIADHADVGDMVVTDVASHSLGTQIVKEYGSRKVGGYFLPIIHRNSVIPTSRTEPLSTVEANQKVMTIDVYEGESRMAQDNRKIGELVVKGIPPGPSGQIVLVTFTYDLDGILEVQAVVEATGKSFTKIFSRTSKSLSEGEIKAAQARIDRIKQDPRDAPAIRDLLARADLLIREVGMDQRRWLEEAIDILEDALAHRDPDRIAEAAQHLESVCRKLDDGERW